MALVVNTNVASLVAQDNLVGSRAEMEQAMERLSSGKRINSAADDAAGLAITNRMQAQTRGLSQAIRNANDGVSLADTAEGTMQEVTNMLQRMRELAVQSANGIYNDSDRVSLNEEVSQLKAEMNRIAETTTFNNKTLMNGSFGTLQLQLGNNQGQSLAVEMADVRASALGTGQTPSLTSYGHFNATAGSLAQDLAAGDLVINGVQVGASLAADDNLSSSDNASSAVAKVAAINRVSAESGVVASVNETVYEGSVMTAGGAAAVTGTITVNGVATASFSTVANDNGASRAAAVLEINRISGQTGVTAEDSGADNRGVILRAQDGRNIVVAVGGAMTAALSGVGAVGVQSGTYTLQSQQGTAIEISSNATSATAIRASGFEAGSYQRGSSTVTSAARTATTTAAPASATAGVLDLGDMVINGVNVPGAVAASDTASFTGQVGSTKKDSAIAIAAAINSVADQTGVTAKANANVISGTGHTGANLSAATLSINGVAVTLTSLGASHTRQELADQINLVSGQTGVVASDNGDGLDLVAEDGRNIHLVGSLAGANYGIPTASIATAATGTTTYSTVSLSSDKTFTLEAGGNGKTNLNALGFYAGTYGGGDGQKIADVSVASQDDALQALAAIDNALETVLSERGKLGAIRNRLDFTTANLANVVTNTEASRSQIEDADFAAESAKMAKNQILLQAGTAMLAQANASQQTVLSLLG